MFKKLRHEYHTASQWAHHHSAMLILGLTIVSAAFGRQFGAHFMDGGKAHASYDPSPRISWCDTNDGVYAIDLTECYALANIYAQLDGPDWNITPSNPEVLWFSDTNVENWYNIDLVANHVDSIQLYGFLNGAGLGEIIDFSGLPYLTYLRLRSSDISGVDLDANTMLDRLELRYNTNMTSLDLSMNNNLTYLDLEGNGLTSIDLSSLPNLVSAYLSYNPISSIDVSNNPLLETFNLGKYEGDAYVTSIDLSNNTSLKNLYLQGQDLSILDLSHNTSIESINIGWNNNLSSLTLPNTTSLYYMSVKYTSLTDIDLSPYTNLSQFDAEGADLTSITFGDNSLLDSIKLQGNSLTAIDLSSITNKSTLMYLYLANNLISDLGAGFDQFTNIGLMDSIDTHDDQLNGNCLFDVADEGLVAFLDSTYTNWASNQTCGRDVPETEYNSLVALYNATDGDNWLDNDGWLQDYSVCDWYGVSCDAAHTHVIDVNLTTNGLNGYIPSLTDLTHLQALWLDNRNNQGEPNIIDVDLSIFDGLENLQSISMYQTNNLEGDFNSLISSADTLNLLNLSSPIVPTELNINDLSMFTRLQDIYVDNNILNGDLDVLSSLPQLKHISFACYDTIDDCDVTGTLDFIDTLPDIVQLNLGSLNLVGTLPASINTLAELEDLRLNENHFTGPLPTLDASTRIKDIQLNMNNFSGEIPETRSSFTDLENIQIGGNNLNNRLITGSLPSSWSNLTNLKSIDVSFTKITGSLPDSWSALTNLDELKVFFSSITGPIPDSWNVFATQPFERFWLNNNHLEGEIPSWIETMDQNFKIDTNCLNIEDLSPEMIENLNTHNSTWTSQSNCLSNVIVDKVLSNENPEPGEEFTLTISYHNIGEQKAPRFQLNEVLDSDIQLLTSVPPETETTVNKELGVQGDMCYDNFLHGNSGPYYDHIAQVLLGFLGNSEEIPNDASSQDIYEYAWAGFMEDGASLTVPEVADMFGDSSLTTGGAITTILCAIVNGSDTTPEALQAIYETIGTDCLSVFGVDYRTYDNECGFGGEDGYRREIGDLEPGATGSIVINLRLIPTNLTVGSEHDAITYLVLDGENLGTNIIQATVTVGGAGSTPTPIPSPTTSGGPGGGNPYIAVDDCSNYTPPVDKSSSFYDAKCEENTHPAPSSDRTFLVDDPLAFMKEVGNVMKSMVCNISQELVESYVFSYDVGVTSVGNICEADMYGPLIRKHLAKFLSMFAIQVLGMHPDTNRVCAFTDMKNESSEMQGFAKMACELGIMGLLQNGNPDTVFNPNQVVNRAIFGTALSRMIYGPIHNTQTGVWYEAHLKALHDDGIMNDISQPFMDEVRGYVMLMLRRAYSILKQ